MPTRLQRLPRQKKATRDPLQSTLFWQLKLLCFTTQVTLLFKATYFYPQNELSFWPKSLVFVRASTFLNLRKMSFFGIISIEERQKNDPKMFAERLFFITQVRFLTRVVALNGGARLPLLLLLR